MMKNKSLGFSVLGVLTLLILSGFASATISLSTSSVTLNQFSDTQQFTIKNNDPSNSVSIALTSQTITDNKGNVATINFDNLIFVIPANSSKLVNANAFIPSTFVLGTSSKSYIISEVGIPSNNVTLTINLKNTLCTFRDDGYLDVSIDDVKVINGFGSDTTWYPLDEIEAKVNVANNGNDTIRSIVVKWELYDKTSQKRILKGEESDFSLKDGDDQTVIIDFKLDSASLKSGDNYVLYVWATGKDEAFSGSPSTCVSTDNIESNLGVLDVTIDSHFVILDSLEIVGIPSCGETIQVSGKVWNIGDSDESDIYLKVYNTALGISQRVEVGDIDSLESKDILFNVALSENAEEGKSYDITFLVYDDSDDIFESSNGDKSEFNIPISIASGSCSTELPVSVSANLETAAKAGEEFSVKATITNTASVKKTFTFELSDYTTWASLVSVDKTGVTLEAGKSADVLIKLKANEGISGNKNFNIVMKEGSKILTQPVSVSVAGKGFGGFNITGLFSGLGGNTYLWAIGALNILLVFVIIIVAVRVVRKK